MKTFTKRLLAVATLAILAASPLQAKTFKWAFQGDVQSLDPHALNETFTMGFMGNVYEALSAYTGDLELVPALAESWSNPEPSKWIIKLRKGVKFQEGGDFNADDVIFSWKRCLSEGSDMKGRAGLIKEMRKIDDYTVEAITPSPNPILMQEMAWLYIMDKEWSVEHKTAETTNVKGGEEGNYANMHANGTGPFVITDRQPDVKTIFKRNENYWGKPKTNITEGIFTPVKQAATRVAALISGELDLIYPVPVQDWKRLEKASGVKPLSGPEARTIFLGMDSSRDELLYSNIKGKNPLKDVRVRKAFAHALNLEAIHKKVMRGASTPAGLLVAPQVNGFSEALNTPYSYDPELSKKLLAEAGYPDGFEITIDCPNNRYVNDEKICQAAAGMLAKIGIKVEVFAQPKSKYFAKVLAQNNYDTSFYLLGWTPGSMDSHNVLINLLSCQNKEKKMGTFNFGNYCNAEIDAITEKVGSETDPVKRQAMINKAFKIAKDEVGYLPIHQQPLSWGVRDGVEVAQRPDNVLDLRSVVIK